jgi:hypothetical protein
VCSARACGLAAQAGRTNLSNPSQIGPERGCGLDPARSRPPPPMGTGPDGAAAAVHAVWSGGPGAGRGRPRCGASCPDAAAGSRGARRPPGRPGPGAPGVTLGPDPDRDAPIQRRRQRRTKARGNPCRMVLRRDCPGPRVGSVGDGCADGALASARAIATARATCLDPRRSPGAPHPDTLFLYFSCKMALSRAFKPSFRHRNAHFKLD